MDAIKTLFHSLIFLLGVWGWAFGDTNCINLAILTMLYGRYEIFK
jgi:hypothetical protein